MARTYAEIEAARRAAIVAGAKLIPKGRCHFCDVVVGARGALWCAQDCADEYKLESDQLLAPATSSMDYSVVKGDQSVPIVSTHHRDKEDATPLQMISVRQLTYYRQLEVAYLGLLQRLAEPADVAPDPAEPGR